MKKKIARENTKKEQARYKKHEEFSEESSDDAECPKCGIHYNTDDSLWVECNGCHQWFDFKCTNIKSERCVPDSFYCEKCI